MGKPGINYLFPPDAIDDLPSWRFQYHFKTPFFGAAKKLRKAAEQIRTVDFKVLVITSDLDQLQIDKKDGAVTIAAEVPEEIRQTEAGREDYESDFWKLWGNMLEFGFKDVFYEAVDWQDEGEG